MDQTNTNRPILQSEPVSAEAGVPRTLTQDLQLALELSGGKPMGVGDLLHVLHERGHAMVLLVLSIPFLVPVPTVGLSTPVGLAVAAYGTCVLIGVEPWIPKFISRFRLSHATLEKIVNTACRAGKRVERLLKPRLKFMLWPGVNRVIGACLIFLGLFLALPLPIPFTNSVPAVGVVLLLLGLLERDGVCVILGQLMCLVIAGILYFAWGVILEALRKVGGWVGLAQAESALNIFYWIASPVL